MSSDGTVTIRGIAGGGDGVGTLPDGRTVFVPRTAPGDRVALAGLRLHSKFARARVDTVVEPGAGRVTPPCPHYQADNCGSCQLMHLDIVTQRTVKGRIVGDALRRIGKLNVADPVVMAAPQELGYRTKVTFTVRNGVIGYHRYGEADEVFEVRHCLLLDPALDDLHQRLRAARALLPADAEQVVLRLDATGRKHLLVRTSGAAWRAGADLAARLGDDCVLWWHPTGGAARAIAGTDSPWPATVFEQVNRSVGDTVRKHAVDGLMREVPAGAMVWDLYAGVGDTTALLVAAGCRVESVELDQRAVALAEQVGPAGPRRLAGDVAERIGALSRPNLVITNPPRAGMATAVVEALAASGAARIIYISCDPATLARDIRRLGDPYGLVALDAFDQFPQTAHVECVAMLERA